MPIKNFDRVCTVNVMSLILMLKDYYGEDSLKINNMYDISGGMVSMEGILEKLSHLAGKEKIIIEMLEKFKDLPNTVYAPIELGHIVPFAEDIAELAENKDKVYDLLKGLSGLDLFPVTSYIISDSMFEYVPGVVKLKDNLADILYFTEKSYRLKIKLFSPDFAFNNADNVLLLAENKDKVQKLDDLFRESGYTTLYTNNLFNKADDVVNMANDFKLMEEKLEKGKTGLIGLSYEMVDDYAAGKFVKDLVLK